MEGRRLDEQTAPLEPLIPEGYGVTGFQSSGVIFATEGCWEIIGRVADQELRIVVEIHVSE